MKSNDIRSRFLTFFQKRGHAIIPSASLVPENDPTVLFNTAGMQPLVPYLMGNKHPAGTRLADSQKCVRTGDIDDIGDNTHCTFFEMLGNWSLGDYFKEDAIKWSYEFLTSKTEGLGLDPARLYVTVFEGDEKAGVPRDTEAFEIWKKVGMPEHRIYFKGADANWWPAVKKDSSGQVRDGWTGPTGPCSEMFYDVTEKGLGDMTIEQYNQADEKQQVVEVWNDVFMEFEKREGKIVGKLAQKNVDTGAGLERLCLVLQRRENPKVQSVFDTDLFLIVMVEVKKITADSKKQRIIADHMRTAVFMISDGVLPSNTDQGYILRRLIRRAIFNGKEKISKEIVEAIVESIVLTYKDIYINVLEQKEKIKEVIVGEMTKFMKTLADAVHEQHKLVLQNNHVLDGKIAFTLFTSYGNPLEMAIEIAKDSQDTIASDIHEVFNSLMKVHQDLSRAGAAQKFKGGLADADEMSVKYHTATHLLHQALRDVLGAHVQQKGSNITAERLRFDFAHGAKMTDEEKRQVETIVNEKITAGLSMQVAELPKAEAEKLGALHFFGDKYGDKVTVYYIGGQMSGDAGATSVANTVRNAYSKEFCGGPHVKNTKELAGPHGTWKFKILKEEAVSAGTRRIKAVLQ